MGTPFEKVFEAFLSKTSDFDRTLMSDDMIIEDMTQLLYSSIPFFRMARVDLTDINYEEQSFNEELSLLEIQILACLMKREWYKRFITDTDVLRQKFGEHDFEFNSQANQLKALVSGQRDTLDKEINLLLSDYDRFPKNKIFDFSRFAGKGVL